MRRFRLVVVLTLVSSIAFSQDLHVGVFGGVSAYQGDLVDKIFPKKVTNGVIGVSLNYELADQLMLRGGFNYTILGGADRYSKDPELIKRNLSFETKLVEFNLIGEYYFFNLYNQRYSPYIFGGLAVYHFNPYSYNDTMKVYLKPLSTEGEGLSQYPDRKPYALTQLALPFGGGVKFAITDNLRVGLEVGFRKLFTDYLDDVSTNYADYNDLLAAKGQLAVDMAYRGDEVPQGSPNYPAKNAQRGGAKNKDWYYFAGIHLTYRLTSGGGSSHQFLGGGKRKGALGCPRMPR